MVRSDALVQSDATDADAYGEAGRGRDAAPSTIRSKPYAGWADSTLLAQAEEASL